jgi:Ca-activated chloride channel homolog
MQVRIQNRVYLSFIAAVLLCFSLKLAGQSKKPPEIPLFKTTVETVFFKVSVTDPMNRYVTGLEKAYFKVYEDNIEQDIIHFSQQTAPVSAGIILDISSSMKSNSNIKKAKNSIARFLSADGNPDDEYFLLTFNHETKIAQTFTSRRNTVQNEVATQKSGGSTALYDAIYMALDHIKQAKNEKKALILVTDGEDNSSRYTLSDIREFTKESDVQLYAIEEQGKEGYGTTEIHRIISLTGGRIYLPTNFNELDYYIDLINSELRNQYVLGYSPSNTVHDGKWRRIKVKLDAPQGLPKLMVHAKEGYYGPKN